MRHLLAVTVLLPSLAAQGLAWITNPANGHTYAKTPAALSWTNAEQLAQTVGGHLATVRNAGENAWLVSTFVGVGGAERLWIGLNDVQTEGTFVWASGEPVTYTNWAPFQPDNGAGGDEDYVHLRGIPAPLGSVDEWNDLNDVVLAGAYPSRGIIEVYPPAAFVPFGAGCTGPTSAVPLLAGIPGEEPHIGTTSRIRVSNLPLAVTVPIFVLGLSNTVDPGPPAYTLPLDLGILGWPGCSQLVSDDVISFAITTTGEADYTLAVPMNLALVGFTFYAQALVLYSGGSVAVSNGVTGVVGY